MLEFALTTAEFYGADGYLGQLGAFAGYTWRHGDVVYVIGSSGGVLSAGLYEILGKFNDHTVRLSPAPMIPGCIAAPAGSDAGVMSSGGPWADETMIDSGLSPGDAVWIRATGTDYTAGMAPTGSGTAGAPIRLFGYGQCPGDSGRPVISGMAHAIDGSRAGDFIIGGLDIRDTTNDGIMLSGGGPRWTLMNIDITDAGAIGIEASGVYDVACIDCRISGSASWGIYGYREFLLDGCEVRGNASGACIGNGVVTDSLLCSNGGYQVRFSSSSAPALILRSTIDGGGSALGIDHQVVQDMFVVDSILMRCTEAIRAVNGGHRVCRSKFWSNVIDYDASQVVEIISAPQGDPMLRDASSGDYRLAIGSPLLRAGSAGGNIGWDQAAARVRAGATHLGMQV